MADIGSEKTDKLIDHIESKLDKLYEQATKEIGEKLNAYFEQHLKQYDKMWQKYMDGKITADEWQKWANGGVTGQHYSALLEALSSDFTHTNQIAMGIVGGYTPEAYAINHNYAMYQMDVAGVNISSIFTLYDRHTVEKLARGKKALLPKPKVDVPKDKRWNRQHIRNAITQGVLQGESIPKIAKRLENVVGMNHSSAVRNTRTAMTGAQNAGRVASYRDAKKIGVKVMNEWLATHDGRTRESHLHIEGERVEVGELFSNECEYPGDPDGPPEEVYNCRCTLIPYLEEYDFDQQEITEEGFEEFEEENVEDEYSRIKEAIEGAKDYDYDWHEENSFSWDIWESLDDEERKGIRDYTGFWYEDMNKAMRAGDISMFGERIEKKIKDAYSGLEHFELPVDMKLYRGLGSQRSLARAFGVSVDEIMSMVSDGSIVGMQFSEKGFASTAANWDKAWHKPVMLDIVAPKGTKGMYVDLISENPGEREILLQNGTIFQVLEAGNVEHRFGEVLRLKVVIVGTEGMPWL